MNEFDTNEFADALMKRLDEYEVKLGGSDESIDVWAVRACGMTYTIISHPDQFSKEEIIEAYEQLAAKAPGDLILAVMMNAPQVHAEAQARMDDDA